MMRANPKNSPPIPQRLDFIWQIAVPALVPEITSSATSGGSSWSHTDVPRPEFVF
jgi:hypothetical protein